MRRCRHLSSVSAPNLSLGFPALLAILLLAASIISLWLPRWPSAWAYLFAASLMSAAFAGVGSVPGLLVVGIAALGVYGLSCFVGSSSLSSLSPRTSLLLQLALTSGFSVIAVGLATGLLPGFEKVVLYQDLKFSVDAVSYSLSLNYGKAAVGIVILGFAARLIRTRAEWAALWRPLLIAAPITIAAVAALSMVLGHTRFDPKWHDLFFMWAAGNLLFTCVAEEAFFRALLQGRLTAWLAPFKYGAEIAWLIASGLFGIAHVAAGAEMVMLATVAGLGYGWVYMKTGRVEAAVLLHFLLNTGHFLFLTYPRLA